MAASTTSHRTYCRICEAHCGLVAEVEGEEQVVAVKPDADHPVSKGYSCVKGLSVGAMHHDPDRVNHPLKRVGDSYERIEWSQALQEIGERVKQLRSAHGDRCIGLYTGNPTYFSLQNVIFSAAFLEALHSPNLFASHSVDANNKFHVATEMYGLSTVHPVPDLTHTDFFLCLGSNPVVSQMSVIAVPNAIGRLKAIEGRGGRVLFVDPRRTETVDKVGEHLFITPGTDVYLLMAMLHVIAHEDTPDLAPLKRVARGVEAFVESARPWTPERVAPITGIAADTIRQLSRDFASAERAALYMSTGVNMGPFGSVAYWLVQGLNLLTGNVDRKGGLHVPDGAFDTFRIAKALGLGTFDEHRTLEGNWHRVAGAFPAAALADEIATDHPERIRALFVSAGNPVHSVPGGHNELRPALDRLDLLVSIDMYRNETAENADYILPATDMLERADFPVSHVSLQETLYAQYTPRVVAPSHERRTEEWIFSQLALNCGASPLGPSLCNWLPHLNRLLAMLPGQAQLESDHLLALALRVGGKVSLKTLKDNPGGVLLDPPREGTFLGKRVLTSDGLVDLSPTSIMADLPRLTTFAERIAEPLQDRLYLIGQRQRRGHNSWMHNNPRIKQSEDNRAILHPSDAATRGAVDGDLVEVGAGQRQVTLRVRVSDEVAPGVVAVPHGWGHQRSGVKRARELGGANINQAIPSGNDEMEPVSGQAIMLGHRVRVQRVEDEKAPKANAS